MPCMLSPSDRQRRTGLQAVARVCTPTLSTQQNQRSKIPVPRVAQASGVDSIEASSPVSALIANVHVRYVLLIE